MGRIKLKHVLRIYLDGSKLRVKELRMAAVLQFYFAAEPRLCFPELHGAESLTLCLVRQHIQHFS